MQYTIDDLNKSRNNAVAKEIQLALMAKGFLDPEFVGSNTRRFRPKFNPDGIIGVGTQTAIRRFLSAYKKAYQTGELVLSNTDIAAILTENPFSAIKTNYSLGDSNLQKFTKDIIRFMSSFAQYIAMGPDVANIVYVEGMTQLGEINDDRPNEFNDVRLVFRILADGTPEVLLCVPATTEPGRFYTDNPLNVRGAARIAFGQYKAWVSGLHNGRQHALVQRGILKLHRDLDKNFKRSPSDPIDIGREFGINQHSAAGGMIPHFIGKNSAGCLVGQNEIEHARFMQIVEQDARFKTNKGYMFISAIISGTELDTFRKNV